MRRPCAFIDSVAPATMLMQAGAVAGGLHRMTGLLELGRVGRVVRVGIAVGHAHIPGSPLGEGDPWHRGRARGGVQAVAVLELEAEQELAARIQRPGIRDLGVLDGGQPPELRRFLLASRASLPGAEAGVAPAFPKRKSRGLDERAHGVRIARVGVQDAVHSGGEHVSDLPRVGLHLGAALAVRRQRRDDGRHAVAVGRGPAVDQAPREG
jgi:hypothetical protein